MVVLVSDVAKSDCRTHGGDRKLVVFCAFRMLVNWGLPALLQNREGGRVPQTKTRAVFASGGAASRQKDKKQKKIV
jgi:hypothetical protein